MNAVRHPYTGVTKRAVHTHILSLIKQARENSSPFSELSANIEHVLTMMKDSPLLGYAQGVADTAVDALFSGNEILYGYDLYGKVYSVEEGLSLFAAGTVQHMRRAYYWNDTKSFFSWEWPQIDCSSTYLGA